MNISKSTNSKIEKIHLDYICNNFDLSRDSESFNSFNARPDLYGLKQKPPFVCELKSRYFPIQGSNRPITDYQWWFLRKDQLDLYNSMIEKTHAEMFFIFLFAKSKIKLDSVSKICEENIVDRELFIVPHDAMYLVDYNGSSDKHIGLARIKRSYDFTKKDIPKGKLFIAKTIESRLCSYF